MSEGIDVPFRVNASGGIALVDKTENDKKIIMTALSDTENQHAYQQEDGMGIEMIFDMNDATVRARILFRLRKIFAQFKIEKRFELKEDTIEWGENEGEHTLKFKYLDLESEEPVSFVHSFGTGGI